MKRQRTKRKDMSLPLLNCRKSEDTQSTLSALWVSRQTLEFKITFLWWAGSREPSPLQAAALLAKGKAKRCSGSKSSSCSRCASVLCPGVISLVQDWGTSLGLEQQQRHRESSRGQPGDATYCYGLVLSQQTGPGSPSASLHLPRFKARSKGHLDWAQREHHRVFHGERISAARHFINPGPDSPPDSPVLGARRGLENKGGLKPPSCFSPLEAAGDWLPPGADLPRLRLAQHQEMASKQPDVATLPSPLAAAAPEGTGRWLGWHQCPGTGSLRRASWCQRGCGWGAARCAARSGKLQARVSVCPWANAFIFSCLRARRLGEDIKSKRMSLKWSDAASKFGSALATKRSKYLQTWTQACSPWCGRALLFIYLYQNYSVCRPDQSPTEGKSIYGGDYLQERGLKQAARS